MNDYLLSLILGIVEGLTEFLPVSSTAHLRLSEALLHISLSDGYWKMYSIVIQLGAIRVCPVYFWSRITKFLSTFPQGESGNRTASDSSARSYRDRLRGHRDSLVPADQGDRQAPRKHHDHRMVAADRRNRHVDRRRACNAKSEAAGPGASGSRIHTWKMEDMSLGQSIWIGFCQIFSAVFPGTSRSMSTIAGGQLAGMSRASALEFSFFVSIPTMAAATLYTLYKSLRGKGENPIGVSQIDAHGWIVLAIGFVVSFIVAYGSVAWFMGYVRKRGFAPFAVYRIIVGVLVLVFAARLM